MGFNQAITCDNVIAALGGIATSTTVLAGMFISFKIHRVRMWSAAVNGGETVSINWNSATLLAAANLEYSDTTMSDAFPAFLDAVPPPGSNASFWNSPATSTLFDLVSTSSAVIDLDVSVIISDQVTTLQTVVTGPMTADQVYFLALDGPSSNLLVPVSVNTTH
jgi:hypothetical protein